MKKLEGRALRQFTWSTGKSAGRNLSAAILYSHILLFKLKLNQNQRIRPIAKLATNELIKELLRHLLVIFIYKFLLLMGYLFMDDLTRAVSQFLHSSPVGMSGGFNQPPAPEGSSAEIPFFLADDQTPDQPGPAALEGEDLAVRNCQEELNKIAALREDPILGKAVQTSNILQEEIIIEVKKAISPGEAISNRNIREGVELYLYDLINSTKKEDDKLASAKNRQLRRILESLKNSRLFRKKSVHFSKILESIDSLSKP